MIGSGSGASAITFLNALFTGTGAAAGVDLQARATLRLAEASQPVVQVSPEGSDTSLARATLSACLRAWRPTEMFDARLTVQSQIPVAKGLKSSSGVGVAIARAAAEAVGRRVSSEEVATLAANVAQEIGLSATGAFDDCLAAAEPGVHVTDNAARRRLRTDPVSDSWSVVLAIPGGEHRRSTEYRSAFQAAAARAGAAESAVRAGEFWEAMRRNSELVEELMGYDYAELRGRLASAGALAVGVSGMGPALAAVVPREAARAARDALDTLLGTVITAPFTATTTSTERGGRP